MAACGSLQQIFENPPPPPLPDNPNTFIHSLSPWNHINRSLNKPIHHRSSFTEIFGELHFQDQSNPESSSSSSSSLIVPVIPKPNIEKLGISSNDDGGEEGSEEKEDNGDGYKKKRSSSASLSMDSFPSLLGNSPTMTFESLQLCTEGLGFESSDDMEDLITNDTTTKKKNDSPNSEYAEEEENKEEEEEEEEEKANLTKKHSHSHSHLNLNLNLDLDSKLLGQDQNESREFRRSKSCGGGFPPPISSIGKTGKPWVSFKSFRKDGRFVLREIRVPTREFLHAFRENGRLKLQLVQPEEDIMEVTEEEEEECMDDLKAGDDDQ